MVTVYQQRQETGEQAFPIPTRVQQSLEAVAAVAVLDQVAQQAQPQTEAEQEAPREQAQQEQQTQAAVAVAQA